MGYKKDGHRKRYIDFMFVNPLSPPLDPLLLHFLLYQEAEFTELKQYFQYNDLCKKFFNKKYIPVGCVSCAALAVGGGVSAWGGGCQPGGVCPGGCIPAYTGQGVCIPACTGRAEV